MIINLFKKLIINNRELISLNENLLYNHDIIKTILNEINIIKETNNKLIKLNEEKDNKIKNLESKYKSLKDDLNNIITSNDLIVKKELTLVYECENESLKNIFGEKFVSENKANLELIIDGKKMELKDKYNLKKGENYIKVKIKNKLTNLSYMFNDCKSLKGIEDLKYLNTECCSNFSYMFSGCTSLVDINPLENWNV